MQDAEQIMAARLSDWRKLGQGLHARFDATDLGASVRLLDAVTELADIENHLEVRVTLHHVDLKLMSHDAIYRDDAGTEHRLDGVLARDLDLAGSISRIAAAQALTPDPGSVKATELALDTADAATAAPVRAVLLAGAGSQECDGPTGNDIRDPSGRVPVLWFQHTEAHTPPRQRVHLDIKLPYDVAAERIAAAAAAGPGCSCCAALGPARRLLYRAAPMTDDIRLPTAESATHLRWDLPQLHATLNGHVRTAAWRGRCG